MSNQLSERDRKILQHIGRNWFTFKEVLSQLFFDGADAQNVLNRLVSGRPDPEPEGVHRKPQAPTSCFPKGPRSRE